MVPWPTQPKEQVVRHRTKVSSGQPVSRRIAPIIQFHFSLLHISLINSRLVDSGQFPISILGKRQKRLSQQQRRLPSLSWQPDPEKGSWHPRVADKENSTIKRFVKCFPFAVVVPNPKLSHHMAGSPFLRMKQFSQHSSISVFSFRRAINIPANRPPLGSPWFVSSCPAPHNPGSSRHHQYLDDCQNSVRKIFSKHANRLICTCAT